MKKKQTKQKPRRRRRRNRKILQPPRPSFTQAVEKIMDRERSRLDLGPYGVEFVDLAVDPFGQDGHRGPKSRSVRFPDGDPTEYVGMTVTGSATMAGSVASSGVIVFVVPNQADSGGFEILHGADATDLTNTPNQVAYHPFSEADLAFQLLSHHNKKYRIIMSGIRVTLSSAKNISSGLLEAGATRHAGRNAEAAYNKYENVFEGRDGQIFNVDAGITTRGYVDDEAFTFVEAPGTQYRAAGAESGQSRTPAVRFRGLNSDTQIIVEVVMHMQVETTRTSCPLISLSSAGLQYEPEIKQAVHYVNSQSHAVTGNSFWSFIKKVASGVGKAFRFVTGQLDPISTLTKALSPELHDAASGK